MFLNAFLTFFMRFWSILMIFSGIFKGFWTFLIVFFASIFRRYSCYWRNFENCWLILMVFSTYLWRFLKVLNGFRYILKVFYCVWWFLTYSQLFFMIFIVFLMSFHVFYTIFDDCGRIFDGQCCFLRYFLWVFTGLAGFWRI